MIDLPNPASKQAKNDMCGMEAQPIDSSNTPRLIVQSVAPSEVSLWKAFQHRAASCRARWGRRVVRVGACALGYSDLCICTSENG